MVKEDKEKPRNSEVALPSAGIAPLATGKAPKLEENLKKLQELLNCLPE